MTEQFGAQENERLRRVRSWKGRGHGVVADRAQRISENGKALEYIELVLLQLQRASRDHQRLVQQRHADFRCTTGKESTSRFEGSEQRVYWYRDRRGDPTNTPIIWSRTSSRPWESDLTSRTARQPSERPPRQPDVTTRLLTKRRNYGGTAQSTVGISDAAPKRIRNEIAVATRQGSARVPEDVGWESARGTFGPWSLPETRSSNDRKTSLTVV